MTGQDAITEQPVSGATPNDRRRSRRVVAAGLLVTFGAGLGSRAGAGWIPHIVTAYGGDVLWTVAAYLMIVLWLPRLRVRVAAATALGLSYATEFSQLYRAGWIDHMRDTRLGALLFGRGFVASDLACYAVGAAVAVVVDLLILQPRLTHPDSTTSAPAH